MEISSDNDNDRHLNGFCTVWFSFFLSDLHLCRTCVSASRPACWQITSSHIPFCHRAKHTEVGHVHENMGPSRGHIQWIHGVHALLGDLYEIGLSVNTLWLNQLDSLQTPLKLTHYQPHTLRSFNTIFLSVVWGMKNYTSTVDKLLFKGLASLGSEYFYVPLKTFYKTNSQCSGFHFKRRLHGCRDHNGCCTGGCFNRSAVLNIRNSNQAGARQLILAHRPQF